MIAIITGDIIASRKLIDQGKWLIPLKNLFQKWEKNSKDWKLNRGDSFQLEIKDIESSLRKALEIKTTIKKTGVVDVRLAIGIGEKTYSGESISESNGPAFINSGEKFDSLKKENITLGVKSPWTDFDEEINLYLKLMGLFMDNWSISSAELMQVVLQNPTATQEEIGKQLGIKQNSVSGRWKRANANEVLAVEKMYRKKINSRLR